VFEGSAGEVLQHEREVVQILPGVRKHPSYERIADEGGDQGCNQSFVVFRTGRDGRRIVHGASVDL